MAQEKRYFSLVEWFPALLILFVIVVIGIAGIIGYFQSKEINRLTGICLTGCAEYNSNFADFDKQLHSEYIKCVCTNYSFYILPGDR